MRAWSLCCGIERKLWDAVEAKHYYCTMCKIGTRLRSYLCIRHLSPHLQLFPVAPFKRAVVTLRKTDCGVTNFTSKFFLGRKRVKMPQLSKMFANGNTHPAQSAVFPGCFRFSNCWAFSFPRGSTRPFIRIGINFCRNCNVDGGNKSRTKCYFRAAKRGQQQLLINLIKNS